MSYLLIGWESDCGCLSDEVTQLLSALPLAISAESPNQVDEQRLADVRVDLFGLQEEIQ